MGIVQLQLYRLVCVQKSFIRHSGMNRRNFHTRSNMFILHSK